MDPFIPRAPRDNVCIFGNKGILESRAGAVIGVDVRFSFSRGGGDTRFEI
jgi:hypothetical protein